MASWIKIVLISTGFVAVAMHLKAIVPVALDFSRSPILLSSILSWLKPPYLYVITNLIIIVIGVSSWFCRIIANNDGKDHEASYSGDNKFQNDDHQQIVHRALPPRSVTKDAILGLVASISPSIIAKKPEVVYEEKEILPEAVKVKEENRSIVVVGESGNIPPVEKPLVTARIGHRKLAKTTTAERNSLRALKVAKPKRNETLENTWKLITERKSTPLTSSYRRPETLGHGDSDSNAVKDRPKFYLSPAVSRSRDELNRRAEAFIKKCNDDRFESMRQDKAVASGGLSFSSGSY